MGLLPGDTRRIQTAVLGGAESDVPLILPLEAIELDAFRREHAADTFWCGLLLGGCGSRLATKLYTDRVCHFAHFPDPTGTHVCRRRARDVASADHLYATAAAQSWLRAQGHHATVRHGTPLGSVVDIHGGPGARGLRLHLDGAVAPVWDDETTEPVLGVAVPVDDRTLVRRRYVNRVRFDSVGTARRVRIGTQAFARDTEWFALDDCALTSEGLHTPAVERINRARTTSAPQTLWRPPVPERRQDQTPPVLRLKAAIASGSRLAVLTACHEIEAAGEHTGPDADPVAAALEQARAWLERQTRERAKALEQLHQAVLGGDADTVRTLLKRVNKKAPQNRSQEEIAVVVAARRFLDDHQRRQDARARQERQEAKGRERQATGQGRQPARRGEALPDGEAAAAAAAAERPAEQPASTTARQPDTAAAASLRLKDILRDLRRLGTGLGPRTLRHLLNSLSTTLAAAGDRVTPEQRREAQEWLSRGRRLRAATTSAAPADLPGPRTARTGPGRGPAQAPPPGPPRLPDHALGEAASAVRGALVKAARERSTTTWPRLSRRLGSALPALHPDDRAEVLQRVDAATPPDEPLLSSLLAATDTDTPALYERLARRLGRPLPAGAHASHWQAETLRLHQLYRHR